MGNHRTSYRLPHKIHDGDWIPFYNFQFVWPGTLYDDLINVNNGGLGPFYAPHNDVYCTWPTLMKCRHLWDLGGSCFETAEDDCSYQSDSEIGYTRAARYRRQWIRASTWRHRRPNSIQEFYSNEPILREIPDRGLAE